MRLTFNVVASDLGMLKTVFACQFEQHNNAVYDGRMKGRMKGWMKGRMKGRMKGWTPALIVIITCRQIVHTNYTHNYAL